MRKAIVLSAAGLLLAGAAFQASAGGHRHGGHHGGWYGGHHGHRHHGSSFGLYLGSPLWWGPGYGPYGYGHGYGYRAPTVVIEREPAVYVQRQPAATSTQTTPVPATLWFYCTDPAGYYPYVQHCNRTWVEVDPGTVTAGQ
jgi:hypothetical protein